MLDYAATKYLSTISLTETQIRWFKQNIWKQIHDIWVQVTFIRYIVLQGFLMCLSWRMYERLLQYLAMERRLILGKVWCSRFSEGGVKRRFGSLLNHQNLYSYLKTYQLISGVYVMFTPSKKSHQKYLVHPRL